MFKILLSLIFSIFFTCPVWAYLTATKIAVTATSSSAGVSSTSEDSDCTDILGVSLTCPVQANFPQICLNGVCETAWPSGGSQTTGSSMLAGNGSGGYTNVTVNAPLSYSGGTLSNTIGTTKLQTGTPSAVSAFTISSLSSGVRYKLILNLLQNTSNGKPEITFNSDTGSNYTYTAVDALYNSGGNATGGSSAKLYKH